MKQKNMPEYVVAYSGDEVKEELGIGPKVTIVINHYWKQDQSQVNTRPSKE